MSITFREDNSVPSKLGEQSINVKKIKFEGAREQFFQALEAFVEAPEEDKDKMRERLFQAMEEMVNVVRPSSSGTFSS